MSGCTETGKWVLEHRRGWGWSEKAGQDLAVFNRKRLSKKTNDFLMPSSLHVLSQGLWNYDGIFKVCRTQTQTNDWLPATRAPWTGAGPGPRS